MSRLSTLFTPQDAQLGLTRGDAQKTQGVETQESLAWAKRSQQPLGRGQALSSIIPGTSSFQKL